MQRLLVSVPPVLVPAPSVLVPIPSPPILVIAPLVLVMTQLVLILARLVLVTAPLFLVKSTLVLVSAPVALLSAPFLVVPAPVVLVLVIMGVPSFQFNLILDKESAEPAPSTCGRHQRQRVQGLFQTDCSVVSALKSCSGWLESDEGTHLKRPPGLRGPRFRARQAERADMSLVSGILCPRWTERIPLSVSSVPVFL